MSTKISIASSTDMASPVIVVEYGTAKIRLDGAPAVRWATDGAGVTHAVLYLRDVSVAPPHGLEGIIADPNTSSPVLPNPVMPPP